MPRVREVGSVNPQTPTPHNNPEKEQITITPTDVGMVDAAILNEGKPQNSSYTGIDFAALVKGIEENKLIPSWLTENTEFETVENVQGDYIGFVEPQSKNYVKLAPLGMVAGDIFAFIKGQYLKVKPLTYFLLDCQAYRTYMNASGQFTFATTDIATHPRDIVEENKLPFDSKYLYNHYVCLLVMILDGKLLPVRADFRGPKEHAGAFAARAVDAAKTPEWLKSSPSHIVTAQMPIHYARVVHTCTLAKDIGKTSGKELFRAHCSSVPATPDQMGLFIQSLQNPEFVKQLDDARNYFANRLDFLDKICEKSANPPPK